MTIKPTLTTRYDELEVSIYPDNETLGKAAAEAASMTLSQAVATRGSASVILATGNSQLTFLHSLSITPNFPWNAINVFHMDEYLNLPPGHSASFPRFLNNHLLDHVDVGAFFPVPGHAQDVNAACKGYELLLRAYSPDLCCLGIGENGHLAFNDPPHVDFSDPSWVKVVELAHASRRQQVNEGHFSTLDDTPTHAITLTIPALLAAKSIIAIVPEARKAEAVRYALLEPVSENCPASILRRTSGSRLLLDQQSAARL